MVTADTIRENWLRIKDDIFETAVSCGRDPSDISIITVSKSIHFTRLFMHMTQELEFLAKIMHKNVEIKY